MRPFALYLGLLGACAAPLGATLTEALTAHRLLTDIAESRVLRIDRRDDAAGSKSSLFAVAFKFERLLWLYAGEAGTRVLGPAPASWPEADEFARRLKAIDPTVERVIVHAQPVLPSEPPDQVRLNNACVVASIAALTSVLGTRTGIPEAGLVLLAYDSAAPEPPASEFVDHCLLVFRDAGRWSCIDPLNPHAPFELDRVAVGAPLDPALVERSLRQRYPVRSARLLTLSAETIRRVSASALWRAVPAMPGTPR